MPHSSLLSRTSKKTGLLTGDVRRYVYQGVESVACFLLEVLGKSENCSKADPVPVEIRRQYRRLLHAANKQLPCSDSTSGN